MMRIFILAFLFLSFHSTFSTDYYVSTSGNDGGNGTAASPWRTLRFAVTKVPANQGHTIRLSAGTFVESGQFNVPPGVNVEGAGVDQTVIKAASSFYFNPGDPGFALDRFLMTLSSSASTVGNQTLRNFTVDGDGKRLHGGIYVKFRSNVNIQSIKVQNTNFCGLWIWDVKSSAVRDVRLVNCSWGSTGWASGALQLANLDNVTIERLNVDESTGYGIKALGSGGNRITNMKVFDSRISVNPAGKWNNGSAPNIAFELWEVYLVGCEIYNTYMDNHLSLVNVQTPATGVRSIRVHHNTFDLLSRAGGHGYGIELSINDAEIDNNWFNGGSYGIANWSPAYVTNWSIHHNTFNNLSNGYPGEIVRSQQTGIHNVKIHNNTVEFSGTTTMNFVGLHKGQSTNIDIKNNLVINSNTSYNWWPNQLIFTEGGASISGLTVSNNFLSNLAIGYGAGSIANNFTGDPKISKSGARPNPYFVPSAGSPLIDKGVNVGHAFQGSAPEIGAHESGAAAAHVAVTGVGISPATVSIVTAATHQLSKTISPANATNQAVSWTSSNETVASVSNTGLVTAKAPGTAVITVKTNDGAKTASSTVTVNSATVSVNSLNVAPATMTLAVNGSSQLSKTISPSNATNQEVTWDSSNSGVATVAATGVVTGKSVGTTVVTCTSKDGNKIASASVTVSGSLSVVQVDNAVRGTGLNQFNYSGSGWVHGTSTGDPYLNNTLSYSNVANNVATVSFTGTKIELYSAKASHHGIVAVSIDNGPETSVDLYSASRQNFAMVFASPNLSSGQHTIKMRVTGSKNSAATGAYAILDYVAIHSGGTTPVSSVAVAPATINMIVNGATQLTKSISPSSASDQNVTWSSSNPAVATVSATGLVTAKANGTATITVRTVDGGKTATTSVSVNGASTSVDLDNANRGTGTNQFNFVGSGWVHGVSSSDPYFNQTVSFSNIANNYLTLSFTGNRIELYSAKASHHGIIAISIDNGPETSVDLYAASRQNFVMAYNSGIIAQGNHILKVRVTGSRNGAGTGNYAIIDYAKVFQSEGGGGGGASPESVAPVSEAIQYYPNPVRSGDILHINVPEAVGQVSLFDLSGVPVRSINVNDNSLQLTTDGLSSGMYVLQYQTRNGKESVKIMVQ